MTHPMFDPEMLRIRPTYDPYNPNYNWRPLGPQEDGALRISRPYVNHPPGTHNVGYKNDFATFYVICGTGDCGRGK
uniref:Uncharacterized protein n=1 Tax=Panagrolaimus sp. JU765 TaxID=591449 RepID=A0AC34QJ40_9BILA